MLEFTCDLKSIKKENKVKYRMRFSRSVRYYYFAIYNSDACYFRYDNTFPFKAVQNTDMDTSQGAIYRGSI